MHTISSFDRHISKIHVYKTSITIILSMASSISFNVTFQKTQNCLLYHPRNKSLKWNANLIIIRQTIDYHYDSQISQGFFSSKKHTVFIKVDNWSKVSSRLTPFNLQLICIFAAKGKVTFSFSKEDICQAPTQQTQSYLR